MAIATRLEKAFYSRMPDLLTQRMVVLFLPLYNH